MRLYVPAVLLVASVLFPPSLRADAFDLYTNAILTRVPQAEGVKQTAKLTPAEINDHDGVLKGLDGALLVVKTNDENYCKLLVQAAWQRVGEDRRVPMLLIHRFVTYRNGTERGIRASGSNLDLFAGFRMNLDIGQVVPTELGADLRYVADGEKVYLEAVKDAKLFVLTKPMPEAAPKKSEKVVVGEKFEPRYFNGSYKVYDDGRRTGLLTLKVGAEGEVTGSYISDKDGQSYDVKGRLGPQPNAIQFTVSLPRVEQMFQGWLFTGDARALTGFSRVGEREAGFYAERVEEK